jgi:uncharacterized protein (DUF433 family)
MVCASMESCLYTPCYAELRITAYDVLEYLASGMSQEEDIRACLAYGVDRERKLEISGA